MNDMGQSLKWQHPVDGKLCDIRQTDCCNTRKYFTDGEMIEQGTIGDDGTITNYENYINIDDIPPPFNVQIAKNFAKQNNINWDVLGADARETYIKQAVNAVGAISDAGYVILEGGIDYAENYEK